MFLARFSTQNPVLVNLLAVTVFIAGLGVYFTMPREIFPDFALEAIRITTLYPGASPEEVEKLVTIKIEDAIVGVEGIDSMHSTSQEGLSIIIVKLKKDTDLVRALNDIQSEIDTIDDFPEDTEDPKVQELKTVFPVITASLYGSVPEQTLKDLARDVKEELLDIPGVSGVEILGIRERQIWVEVYPEALERYQLTLDEIKDALARHNLNVPGGTIKTERLELLVRTLGEVEQIRELERIALRSDPYGNTLMLGQVATIVDRFEEATTLGRFNGQRAINLQVTKEKTGNAITIAEAVRQRAQSYAALLPPGVQIDVFNDFSVYIKNRLQVLKSSGLVGLFLVLVTLCVFLNWRVAFLTAFGIPIAFMGAFVLMEWYGISLNMLSMFSLIIALGMLVDDAIIIAENVYRHVEAGLPPKEAAIRGTSEVLLPVIASTATTIAAFLPMLLMTGTFGKFMSAIPIVVSFALLASLFEAFLILPSHLADFLSPRRILHTVEAAVPSWKENTLQVYERFLRFVLQWKEVSLACALSISLILIAFAYTRVPFTLFEAFESSQFFINFETSPEAPLEKTAGIAAQLEKLVLALPAQERKSLVTNVGISFLDINTAERGSNLGQLIVELSEPEERTRTSNEIMNQLREQVTQVPGINKILFLKPEAGPQGPAIEIHVVGEDLQILSTIADQIKERLRRFPGTKDIRDNFTLGKRELRVYVREAAKSYGLDSQSIARQVRNSFAGVEASTIQRSEENIPLIVKFAEQARQRVMDLSALKLTTPSGLKVPLQEVALVQEERGYTKVTRRDRKRAITIFTDVDSTQGNALTITEKVRKEFANLSQQYPGYRLEIAGERKEAEESILSLIKAFVVALLLIYFILGSLFQSFLQPFVVLFALPFAIDGVIIGHILMGKHLSILSLLGLVALSGVVVNDSLVLVSYINTLRQEGVELYEAIVQAAKIRFRPIFLTSITTIAGLSPLAFFATGQAKFLSPMAIAIVWGLAFATILTLIIVPCFYALLEDGKNWLAKQLRKLSAREFLEEKNGEG